MFGGKPGDFEGVGELKKRAWISAWPNAEFRRRMMAPPDPNTPDGIYWFYLHATGDEELALLEKKKAIMTLKIATLP